MAKPADIELIEESDRISALPDEILVSILCLLSSKESTATSILGRRWRYLWSFRNKLDFDGEYFFRKVRRGEINRGEGLGVKHRIWSSDFEEISNYIAWVNNVLEYHKCSTIEEFRLDFFLYKAHKTHIDRWVRFASDRQVQRLDLNFKLYKSRKLRRYTLPLMKFEHLRTMRMQWVNVSGEDVESLLSNCPLLEELSVSLSLNLTELKIKGPFPKLKRLEINDCECLTSLKIHDADLVSLKYWGKKLNLFVLRNVLLVEMHIGGRVMRRMRDFVSMFSSYLPRLEKLTIDTMYEDFIEEMRYAARTYNVNVSNLRQFVVKFFAWRIHECRLMAIAYFLRASPLLESVVLEGGPHNHTITRNLLNSRLIKTRALMALEWRKFLTWLPLPSIKPLFLVTKVHSCPVAYASVRLP